MNISYDNTVDAMYIKLKDGTFGRNEEVSDNIILDLSKKGDLLGIEILNASKHINLEKDLGNITFQLPMKYMGSPSQQ